MEHKRVRKLHRPYSCAGTPSYVKLLEAMLWNPEFAGSYFGNVPALI